MDVNENKERFIWLLSSARADTSKVCAYLLKSSFFSDPASTRFHGCHPGGLCLHSINVYQEFEDRSYRIFPNLTRDDVVLCGLLHDVCKIGAYVKTADGYVFNQLHPKGHGELSLKVLEPLIKLTPLQEDLIRFHMGVYYTREFSSLLNEYSLMELMEKYRAVPECKLFHICDELATMKEKARDK